MATNNALNINLAGQVGSGAIPGYVAGTWTPVDASGAALVFTGVSGNYIRIGNLVIASCILTYPATADVSDSLIGGLPFTVNASNASQGGSIQYANSATMARISTLANSVTFAPYTSASARMSNTSIQGVSIIAQLIYMV